VTGTPGNPDYLVEGIEAEEFFSRPSLTFEELDEMARR
jgi:hypothetical protein